MLINCLCALFMCFSGYHLQDTFFSKSYASTPEMVAGKVWFKYFIGILIPVLIIWLFTFLFFYIHYFSIGNELYTNISVGAYAFISSLAAVLLVLIVVNQNRRRNGLDDLNGGFSMKHLLAVVCFILPLEFGIQPWILGQSYNPDISLFARKAFYPALFFLTGACISIISYLVLPARFKPAGISKINKSLNGLLFVLIFVLIGYELSGLLYMAVHSEKTSMLRLIVEGTFTFIVLCSLYLLAKAQ